MVVGVERDGIGVRDGKICDAREEEVGVCGGRTSTSRSPPPAAALRALAL
jgi:hypothetical protein